MARKVAYAAFGASAVAVAYFINSEVPEPYMDEVVHVPQAQAYCRGDWSYWDPLLTTPPGPYLISAFISHSLPLLQPAACNPASLRLLNVGFLLLLPLLYSQLLLLIRHSTLRSSTRGKVTPSRAAQDARDHYEEAYEGLVVAGFPVAAFFAWLYYTDLGSLVFVMLSLREGLRKRWAYSALAGAASLFFRQTNIIWVAFIAATCVVRRLQPLTELHNPPLANARLVDIPKSLFSLLSLSLFNVPTIFPLLRAYVPVFVGALAFVLWNGGIVLGDKTNHVPTFHFTQLYYFSAFSAAFLAPIILSPSTLRRATHGLVGSPKRITCSAISLIFMCWTIKHYTLSHPFLLSDNRHYTFYVYRRILNVHPIARYALSPFYLLSIRLLWDRLSSSSTLTLLPSLFYILSLSLTLIPSPLIEPRYFIVPWVILRLHLRIEGATSRERRTRLALEAASYLAVNAVTVGVFVCKPFEWEGRVDKMRFMW